MSQSLGRGKDSWASNSSDQKSVRNDSAKALTLVFMVKQVGVSSLTSLTARIFHPLDTVRVSLIFEITKGTNY